MGVHLLKPSVSYLYLFYTHYYYTEKIWKKQVEKHKPPKISLSGANYTRKYSEKRACSGSRTHIPFIRCLKTFTLADSADGYMHFTASIPVVCYSLSPLRSIQAICTNQAPYVFRNFISNYICFFPSCHFYCVI